MTIKRIIAMTMATAGLGVSGAAAAEDVHVIATGALQGAMKTLKPAYEKKTGNTLVIAWGPSFGTSPEAIPERIRNREPMDVTIGTEETLDAVAKSGVFDPTSRKVIALSQIGIAVPKGQPHPDVSTEAAVRQALLSAKRVAYSQGASGVYIKTTMLPKLGIADQIAAKTVVAEGRELVGTVLARGEADIGMQQVSELKVTPGVDFLGPLPAGIQKVSRFAGMVSKDSRNAKAARGFLAYLASAEARPLIEASGLDPVRPTKRR
ncbi:MULTISPECIES: molybdate ABC transporter substrate-binding protein [Sphingomonas]|uniref:molybdate ABC transporter substrate-binding protein n=1 Tax=Sphingomonas TaxID=13687 RepID=UPI0024135BF1|nr:molybdate ABC transporter substrate-binding protein [Sphingomonas echinoides]